MLIKPVVHELDANAVFLRGQNIILHRKKLDQIKHRKNIFEGESSTISHLKRFNKMKLMAEKVNPFSGFHNSLHIRQDNNYLSKKILKINKRENKTFLPDRFEETVKSRNKFFESIRYLQNKQIDQDNQEFFSRLTLRAGSIDSKKLNEDYLFHQKIFNQLRRIKPRNASMNLSTSIKNLSQTNISNTTKAQPSRTKCSLMAYPSIG